MKIGTILIVDDEVELLKIIATSLSGQGYSPLPVPNVAEALQTIESHYKTPGNEIQAIISDWMMPERDGVQFLTELRRSHHKEIPFLLMSGAVSRDLLVSALQYDPDAVILKPFLMDALCKKIQEAIDVRGNKEVQRLLHGLNPKSSKD